MDAASLVSLGLLVALAVAAVLVVRRMTQIAARERTLVTYADGMSRVVSSADAALDRGASAVDALVHGRGSAAAAAAEVQQATAEIEGAEGLLRSLTVPPGLEPRNRQLDAALGAGRQTLENLAPGLEALEPGRRQEDPRRLEASRAARRALLAALWARDDVHVAERRIEAEIAAARSATGRRGRAAAG